MVLRHFLIASQLQLLDSPPTFDRERRDGSAGSSGSGDGGVAAEVVVAEATAEGYDGDTERKEDGGRAGRSLGESAPAVLRAGDAGGDGGAGSGSGKGRRRGGGVDGTDDGEGKAAAAAAGGGGGERDWHGTSSDAFEIAMAVLKVTDVT